jgi:hypothetical protein
MAALDMHAAGEFKDINAVFVTVTESVGSSNGELFPVVFMQPIAGAGRVSQALLGVAAVRCIL